MKAKSLYEVPSMNGEGLTVPGAVDYLVSTAVELNASDIHLGRNNAQGESGHYKIRFRVNGMLQPFQNKFISDHYEEVVNRIKVLAKMDTTAVGETQDGQISLNRGSETISLRVSILPGFQGIEEVCIRLQKSSDKDFSLNDLIMTQNMRTQLENLIHQKSGMFLLNGPAGSGKTSTIYAILKLLASPERKIITAEDPVEMEIEYVDHVQVTPKASFADLSRAFMRQDAEIIFIGEIRDPVSAQTAQQLAQTGHLVFSTLHTRDAFGVLARMEALNVPTDLIANTLIGSLAQRLVRGLCAHCRQPDELDKKTLAKISKIFPLPEGVQIYKRGEGCSHCTPKVQGARSFHGYTGRIPIFELLVVDEDIADMIAQRTSRSEILAAAQRKGMLSLKQESLLRLYQGFVDLESIRSLVFSPTYS